MIKSWRNIKLTFYFFSSRIITQLDFSQWHLIILLLKRIIVTFIIDKILIFDSFIKWIFFNEFLFFSTFMIWKFVLDTWKSIFQFVCCCFWLVLNFDISSVMKCGWCLQSKTFKRWLRHFRLYQRGFMSFQVTNFSER